MGILVFARLCCALIHTEDTPQLGVIMNMAWIEVISDRPFKKCGILRNDRQASSQIKQANCGDVEAVDAAGMMILALISPYAF